MPSIERVGSVTLVREGTNPAALSPDLAPHGGMRAIVPVHAPAADGYHRHSLEIMRLCLDSIAATTSSDVAVTVIANGCAPEVVDELLARAAAGDIDQVVVNATNRGKVDAVLSVARGAWEEHLLLADADALLLPGWQAAALEVLRAFPECGVLGLAPAPHLAWYETSATVLGALTRRLLARGPVADVEDLERFAASVGTPALAEVHRSAQLHVERGHVRALIGAGHFCFVTSRRALAGAPSAPSSSAAIGAEQRWLDAPPDRAGWWRLSLPRAHALHLGNVPEPWMQVPDAAAAAALLPPAGWDLEAPPRPPRTAPPVVRRVLLRAARAGLDGPAASLLLR